MEVILLERVGRLGGMGDKVNVRPGFARNFLIPQKKALRATPANIEYFEKRRAEIEARNAAAKSEAEAQAKQFRGVSVTITRQASEDGKLYGAISSRDVAAQLAETGKKIDRKFVQMDTAIRNIGSYEAKIVLHPEVVVDVPVTVVRSTDSAEVIADEMEESAEPSES